MTLPDFVIIGAPKAATTSLYHWLRQHPEIYLPDLKEPMFFCFLPDDPTHRKDAGTRFPITTLDQYEALFAPGRHAAVVGEATAAYFDVPYAPAHMQRVIPDAKLIASLRDPVGRVFSHAQMSVRTGHADDVEVEVRRLAATDEPLYAPKLRRWLEHFPRERLAVFRYDDVVGDTQTVLREIYRFLGVDDAVSVDTGVAFNPGGLARSSLLQRVIEAPVLRRLKPLAPEAVFRLAARARRWNAQVPEPLPPDLVTELRTRFRDDIVETQELVGLDLSAWLA